MRLLPIIGDIRDIDTVNYAVQGADTVIHLAALKHIDLCELYPQEAVDINVHGTENLLSTFAGDTFVGMSTDKAAEATNCYGATKLIMEKLILDKARQQPNKCYLIVRSGNLFGSTGSVITKWKQQIKQCNRIDITNPAMTRFFIDANSVADFILSVIENGQTGSVNIPYQKALCLSDLAAEVVSLWGNKATAIRTIPPRAGEKTHESLFSPDEKIDTYTVSRLSNESSLLSPDEICRMLRELDED
jgi:FlaA1/EpsC-like NDP-sugar epimerase